MRAEMAGNEAKAAQLRQQLAAARGDTAPATSPAAPAAQAAPAPAGRRETQPIVAEDMEGRALVGAASRAKTAPLGESHRYTHTHLPPHRRR